MYITEGFIKDRMDKYNPTIEHPTGRELIVLIHGWISSAKAWDTWTPHLLHDYKKEVYRLNVPTTFGSLSEMHHQLHRQMSLIDYGKEYNKIHFVGHSMGGLCLQYILNSHKFDNIGRCVTLGTPYLSTPFADKLKHDKKWLSAVSFSVGHSDEIMNGAQKAVPKNRNVEFGLVAGTKTYTSEDKVPYAEYRKEFTTTNDGTVEVPSAFGLKNCNVVDYLKVPYNHSVMVRNEHVLRKVMSFLNSGKF